MRIALVCTEKLPVPPVSGGAIQVYIDGILPILCKNHEITVFSLQHKKLPDEEISGNIRYIRVRGRTRYEYLNNIKDRISDEYDLIHIFNRPLWVVSLSKVVPNSNISLSLHNEMFLTKKIDADRATRCIDRVKFITTVSRFIADGVKNLYPAAENKLNVVYSGADMNQYNPIWSEEVFEDRKALRQRYGVDDYKVVLYVGRLSKKKGAHILLQAMKQVMDIYPQIALMLIGSKWYGSNATDEYVKYLQLMAGKLNGPVIFTGFLPPSEMPKHYCVGDIFTCVSQWDEPLARIHYEAMAAGLPLITTDRGGNAEVIQEGVNGLVIKEYNNPEVLAEKIIYLIEHQDIALNMGKTARKFGEENYHWDRVANQLLELFEKA